MVEATLGFDGDRIKRTEIAMIAIGAETKQHLGLFEADHPATAYARQCKAKPAKARAKQCDPAVGFRLQPVGEAGKLVGRTGTEKRMAPDHLRCVQALEIGRASCRERVCQYGEITVVAERLKKKNKQKQDT